MPKNDSAKSSYTRYVDDLTFSCHSSKLLERHGIIKFDSDGKAIAGKELLATIKSNGFELNHKKTRLQSRGNHQGVTGITVNEKVNVTRTFIRKTSSILHAINKWGPEKAEKEHFDKYRKGYIPARAMLRRKNRPGDLIIKIAKGRVNYIKMIRGESLPIYRRLAYELTVVLGVPNEDLKKDWKEWLSESVFVVSNYEAPSQGTCVLIKDIGFVTNGTAVGATKASDSLFIPIETVVNFHKKGI
ncbi:hypothetical protein [Alteromonas abrolhosensis]|uniref:hypothetical protein n=1 Tax=Alteromonas abrolhosensis TaxID=1892904 RepID=UPI0035153370